MGSVPPLITETLSIDGTGSGRQAGSPDHTVQGTASSSADIRHTVPQDPCSSSPPVIHEQGESSGATMLCGEEGIEQRAKKRLRSELKLELEHKIFLSHSGKQKLFATYLCEALQKRGHEPFFDRLDSSLPKGEKFAELIIEAARQCEMLVVVVSEDYFMSKWPMIELSAFVQASKQRNMANAKKPKVLPLFYKLSINEVRDEGNCKKWYKQWEQFEGDDRIKLEDWKEALEQLPSYNGISYDQGDFEVYRETIVSSICSSIRPDTKWDDDHVQGKKNICKNTIRCGNEALGMVHDISANTSVQTVREKINQSKVINMCNVNEIGIFGVGGGGKTTMCKVLCNEFTCDFEGRVCHLEFKSNKTNLEVLLRKALMNLAMLSVHDIEGFDEDQCLAKVRKVTKNKKVFMALDNVWDEGDSIRIAKKLMGGLFHEGSVIMVTSRSLKTLESLNLNGKACFEVPELEKVDATSLFKYHAFPKKESFSKVEMEHVSSCVERCNFEKGNGRTHYHPLALEALGILTSTLSLENLSPEEWGAKLRSVMDFDHHSEGNGVFDILRTSFDKLSQDDQNLFMDVAYLKTDEFYRGRWDKKWLCCVHEKNEVELQAQLDILKRRGLLQHIEQSFGEVEIHDLYIEFAQKELSGTFNKADLCENQKWMEIENVCNPIMKRDRNWSKLTRLHVVDIDESHDLEILIDLDLQYFSRVEVLTLDIIGVTLGTLNLEPMKCLRSINMASQLRCF